MRFTLPEQNPGSLASYIRRYRGLFYLEAIGGIIYNTIAVAGPIVVGKVIDAANRLWIEGQSPALVRQLLAYCLLLVGLTAFFQFARYIKRRYIRDMCFRIRSDMRAGILERTLQRPAAALERESVGDLISRTIGDVEQVVSTVESTINETWDTWLLMLSYLAVLLFYSARITLICSIPVPLALWLAETARHPLYRYSVRARQAASRVTSHLHASLGNVALLRLFGREQAERERLASHADEQIRWTIRTALLQTGLMPVYATIASLGVVGVLSLGSQQVLSGRWTVGAFTAYLTMFLAMSRRTWVAARVFNRWHAAKASWDRIREKLFVAGQPLPADVTEPHGLPTPDLAAGSLVVNDLSFRYPAGERDVLQNISFTVPLGSLVGVTGAVGSGKSALAAVLTGLYPYNGSVQIAGTELSRLDRAARQSLISYATQEPFLFSASIADNVAFGEATPDRARVLHCLQLAALSDDLALFSQGVDTIVRERGVRASGGQRQRIALARALYAGSPVLILDDPFSAVDIGTERRMIERLKQDLADGTGTRAMRSCDQIEAIAEEASARTVFIFSHRLQVFAQTDYVLVLDQGRLVQQGTHQQLLAVDGIYRRIYDAQTWMEGGQHVK